MEERRIDSRIFIVVTGSMFLCIIGGGLLLGLYLFLPESQSPDWYPIAGIVLVSTPWFFWFFVLLYNCFKSRFNGSVNQSSANRQPAANNNNNGGGGGGGGGATIVANLPEVESPVCDSPGDGKRRVHFGAVVVLGNKSQIDRNSSSNESQQSSSMEPTNNVVRSRESEVPLRSSTSSSS